MSNLHGCCIDKKYGKGCTPETCMELPDGKTCANCHLFRRCHGMGIARLDRTSCDFFPRKFGERDEPHTQADIDKWAIQRKAVEVFQACEAAVQSPTEPRLQKFYEIVDSIADDTPREMQTLWLKADAVAHYLREAHEQFADLRKYVEELKT